MRQFLAKISRQPDNDSSLVLKISQVSEVPHEEVPEEAQRPGLAAGDRIQQGPEYLRAAVLQHR